jgi:hypothetical protein
MSGLHLKPQPHELIDARGNPITMEAIKQRVLDGIFIGGDYLFAYDEYLTAHRDRMFLLRLIESSDPGRETTV